MSETFSAVTPAHPPHPRGVFKVLKNARRRWLKSGNALGVAINTIANQLATATTTVAGTVTAAAGVRLPTQVTITLLQAAVVKGTQTVAVTPVTGAYTATFVANTLVAGPASATVTAVGAVAGTNTSNTFTVT